MKIKAMLTVLAIAAMVFVAAGCGDDDEGTATTTPTSTASASEPGTTSASPTQSPEPFSGARDPVEKDGPAVPPVAVLTEVRIASHEGFDRVVFEFTDNVPGYRIEYVDPPIQADPSDEVVDIEGSGFLRIVLTTAQAHDEEGNSTITEREQKPGLPTVIEAELVGDFEGYVTWVVGLTAEADFRVSVLSEPDRVVVDVAHP